MQVFFRITVLFAAMFFLGHGHSYAQKYITQKISFEALKGTWKVKDSRDIKTFEDKKLAFHSVDAHCYLKSEWTFDSDSTGFIVIHKTDKCTETTFKFTFQLLESPGYGGPLYKMNARFENGVTEVLNLSSSDGEKNMKLGYNQPIVYLGTVDNSVWINYNLKKQ